MNFGFTEEQDTIRETLARMLGDHATLEVAHNRLDSGEGFDTATWSALAKGGWLGLAMSEAEGGSGMGAIELAILAEEVGRSLAAIPFILVLCMAVPAIQSAGTEGQRKSLLPGIADGRTILATALSEGGVSHRTPYRRKWRRIALRDRRHRSCSEMKRPTRLSPRPMTKARRVSILRISQLRA